MSESYRKIFGIPYTLAIVLVYCTITFPFLLWHERHLPIAFIVLLSLVALIIGAIIFFISLLIIFPILKHGFHPIFEVIIIIFYLLSSSLSGFLSNSGGRVFLGIFGLIVFLLRFAKVKQYYIVSLLGMVLFSNALLSFMALQKLEVITAYYLFRSRFQFQEVDLSDWNWEEESRILTNRSLPLKAKIPLGLYFHNPKHLNLREKTGAGQIAGILSSSEKDPNIYPLVRIFFIPVYLMVSVEQIREEFIRYNEFLVQQGDIEEVNEIQPNRDFTYNGKIPPNGFWTFYDVLRPRYSKTGFYFMESANGSKVILHIIENLEKGKFHEPVIQDFLNDLRLE